MTERKIITDENCRYGTFSFYEDDHHIGRSLTVYGEYSDYETEVFRKILREGCVAIEVGANIGSLTVPMAQLVGDTGKVYAIEPGVDTFKLLCKNIEQNGLSDRVVLINKACSDKPGKLQMGYDFSPNFPKVEDGRGNPHLRNVKEFLTCEAITVDSLNLPQLDFAKIDVDGCEQSVLDGMRETIARCRPIIYIENELPEKGEKLTATLIDLGYRGYWYVPPLYRSDNHKKVEKNIFPATCAIMQIYVPDEEGFTVKGCDEVSDIRLDDQIFEREVKRYAKYVERDPDDLGSRSIMAHYLGLLQRLDEADKLLDENLRRDPTHLPSRAVRGFHEMQKGNYKDGWQLYELRFQQKKQAHWGGDRTPNYPRWNGEITDDPILIWSEQGFGDSIMYARYFKYVLQRAPNAVLEVQSELYELFENSPIAMPGNIFRINRSPPNREYKSQCSLPSCPAALQDDGSMIPIDRPYLFADKRLRMKWKEVIGKDRKIGICWEGSPRSERPYTRNIDQSMFRFIDNKHGPLFSLVDNGQFGDFAATAAAIMELDLTITVDTSIAHLAGALGKEVWLLLAFDPDFRWGLHSDRTIWYPTMRIFRQKKVLDWKPVIEEVEAALDERYASVNSEAAE